MKNPAQLPDHRLAVKRNLPQRETSPNKKKKLDVTEEEMETENKHNSSVFLIDTRFCNDTELNSTVESSEEEEEFKEELKEEFKEESEEEESSSDESLDEIEGKEMVDSNKNSEIFLHELKQSVEASDESVDGFPPNLSASKYPIKDCRVICRKLDPKSLLGKKTPDAQEQCQFKH